MTATTARPPVRTAKEREIEALRVEMAWAEMMAERLMDEGRMDEAERYCAQYHNAADAIVRASGYDPRPKL